ncbi:MAG: BREX system P-loop protein BrxC, partial [Myxococcales bacterium]|nr:BREX system P-loop protein BrxC [Myxococcales bacterium]
QAWFLALGQQKLDEDADDSFLTWARDRFPPKLRVHLAATNIRDVVHKRLLHKTPQAEAQLRQLFEQHRPDLKLLAYECQDITAEEFIEVYPMLPKHIDLILQITTALRARSSRSQGDDQAIRGLLQLLGELFRDQALAEKEVGDLVTLEQIYEVQHTALDSDVQGSMARIQEHCSKDSNPLLLRAAKAVALLELIQDTQPTTAKLVSQCLYSRMGQANEEQAVTEALEELRRRNLLGYSEKDGYKIQSSAAEEWERERREIPAPREVRSQLVQDALKYLVAEPERPRLQGRPFPWAAVFSDGRRAVDVRLLDPRDDAAVQVDFRFLSREDAAEAAWLKKSDESTLRERVIWICGDPDALEDAARELRRSEVMCDKYKPRRASLNAARKLLLQQEENRKEDLQAKLRKDVAGCWMQGKLYFRGRSLSPQEQGSSFNVAMQATGNRLLPELYPHFIATLVQPSELLLFLKDELNGAPTKFLAEELGILELDSGRLVPVNSGVVPSRVLEYIDAEGGASGAALLSHFGGPPYGYTVNVIKACIAGLLRGGKLRITPESGGEITSTRDAGVQELLEKDRAFRRASILPAGDDDVGVQSRARICKFFWDLLEVPLDREDHAIADAVANYFPDQAKRLRDVLQRLNQLPRPPKTPDAFDKLQEALERCIRSCRQTKPTVRLVKQHLDTLRDGLYLLNHYAEDLKNDETIIALRDASNVVDYQGAQLKQAGLAATNAEAAITRIEQQLALDRPWNDLPSIQEDVQEVRDTYISVRQDLLNRQEEHAERARVRLKGRDGYSILSDDKRHQVLRIISNCLTNTSTEATSPPLINLKEPFDQALRKAEEEANLKLDELLSEGEQPLIQRFSLSELRNRELTNEADVEALLSDLRGKLMQQILAGHKVRLF